MSNIFAFCGPMGSGKSSVSKMLAARAGIGWTSFGGVVREIALERGAPASRESLQALGAKLVESERESFCRRVVEATTVGSSESAVIDGLRHVGVLQELRHIVRPRMIVCVYVDASRQKRVERLKGRDGVTAEQLSLLESHSTESEVEGQLKAIADFVAENRDSVEECVDSIIEWARKQKLLQ
jgi:dephospho-CoA kinase